jgi:hypothetical protein
VLDGGRRQRFVRDLLVQIFLANEHAAPRAAQDLHELALAQHRVARHDHGAALPHGEHRDHDLRDVLQVDGDAVARLDAAFLEADGECVGERVAVLGAQRVLEVVHERRGGITSQRRGEHRERRLAPQHQRWRHAAVQREPWARGSVEAVVGAVVVARHRCTLRELPLALSYESPTKDL